MIDTHWPVQDAKQRFSELVRRAESDGPQFITRHGAEVAVILDIDEYRVLTRAEPDFKEFLREMPKGDDLDTLGRETEPMRWDPADLG